MATRCQLSLHPRRPRDHRLKIRHHQVIRFQVQAVDVGDELKKEFEETKRDVWDESATRGIKDLDKDLAIDTGALDIPELDITRPIPSEASAAGSSTRDAADAGDATSRMNEAERPSERSQ